MIKSEFGALHEAAHDFAGAQIRHRGTLGGNICNASPAGDLLPALYAFDARLEVLGQKKRRQIAVRDFIRGPGQTELEQGEVLAGVEIRRRGVESHFVKVGLRASMAISVLNFAVVYRRENKVFTELHIAAGAVAPTVVLLETFCRAFLKQPEDLKSQLNLIDETIAPMDDIRASASYRRKVLKNLIEDFLKLPEINKGY